jgi:hypothetical protein
MQHAARICHVGRDVHAGKLRMRPLHFGLKLECGGGLWGQQATAFGCVTSWNGSRVVSRLNISSGDPSTEQEILQYRTHASLLSYTDPVMLEDNPLGWWKQHGHLFPTLSRLAHRYLATPAVSCPVERLFSVAGQVDAAHRSLLSPDNLTLLSELSHRLKSESHHHLYFVFSTLSTTH